MSYDDLFLEALMKITDIPAGELTMLNNICKSANFFLVEVVNWCEQEE
jgi:hypothetical protein